MTTLPPEAMPAQFADNPGPHLILLALLVSAGAGLVLYRRLRRKKEGR
jgi:hypothetical protein